MNILNKKGFNFIEVLIAVVILGLIVGSFAQLYSLSVDLPVVSNRSMALYYAQREMENLNNLTYDQISSVSRTNYTEDPNYDYEIKVIENSSKNKKLVYVIFYEKNKPNILVDLFSEFIKLERLRLCDDFQDNSWAAPTWNWTRQPSGQWDLVIFPSNSGNYRVYYPSRQVNNFIFPDWVGGSNYSVSIDFYMVNDNPGNSRGQVHLFGRFNNSTNNGYVVTVATIEGSIQYPVYTDIILYRVVNNNNQIIRSVTIPYLNLFNAWHNLKLEFYDYSIRVYLNNNLYITATDSQFSFGSIRISLHHSRRDPMYVDNVCIEEP